MLHINEEKLITLLELATCCVADKSDSRNYLHDVITTRIDNDLQIVAANGHVLIKINIKNNTIDNEFINVPDRLLVKSIKDAVKVKNLTLLTNNPETEGRQYPEIKRLIPEEFNMGTDIVGINVGYLATTMTALAKCCKKLSSSKHHGVKIVQTSKDNANVFTCKISDDIEILLLIMPMRL